MKFFEKIFRTTKEIEKELAKLMVDTKIDKPKELTEDVLQKQLSETTTDVIVETKETLDAFYLLRRK